VIAGENMKKLKIFMLLLAMALLSFLYIDDQISNFRVNRVELQTEKLEEEIRITQITDFHSNDRVDLNGVLESVRLFDPDFIALTGDIIDFKTVDFSLSYELIDRLVETGKPVYFVYGNHEHGNQHFREFINGIEDRGVDILDERSVELPIGDNTIMIYGSDFYSTSDGYEKLFSSVDARYYNILLAHSPNRPIPYLHGEIDLMLSGHTHGGQVRLPIVGGVLSPGEGFFPEYDKGLMKIGDTTLYIDSGLGNSVLPIRLFNPVQISEIIIK
jgi:hypothetical protein